MLQKFLVLLRAPVWVYKHNFHLTQRHPDKKSVRAKPIPQCRDVAHIWQVLWSKRVQVTEWTPQMRRTNWFGVQNNGIKRNEAQVEAWSSVFSRVGAKPSPYSCPKKPWGCLQQMRLEGEKCLWFPIHELCHRWKSTLRQELVLVTLKPISRRSTMPRRGMVSFFKPIPIPINPKSCRFCFLIESFKDLTYSLPKGMGI